MAIVSTGPDAPEASAEPVGAAPAAWRVPIFGLVDEVRVRRRASDAVRLAVALLVVLVIVVAAEVLDPNGPLYDDEVDLLPRVLSWVETVVLWAGSFGILFGLTVAGLVGRRWRLVVTTLVVGAVGVAAAVAITGIVDAAASAVVFPALAVATASVVGPYLTRPAARTVEVAAAVTVIAAGVSGVMSPVALVAAVVGGWGSVAALRLVAGSPAGVPSARQVAAGAAALGVELTELRPLVGEEWGVEGFEGRRSQGDLAVVTVYGRDAEDARLLSRVWRFLWYRPDGQSLAVSRVQQVEHEALVLLMAHAAGAAVPEVLAAGVADTTEDALLVALRPAGARLDELDDDRLTDEVLDRAWSQVDLLHRARLAHGCLDGQSVLVADDGSVALVNLRRGSLAASPDRVARDVAQLLTTLALRVGAERAVASAVRSVDRQRLIASLAQLQPAAFAGETRSLLRHAKGLVKDLRSRTATACAVDVPELVGLRRVSLTDVVAVVGTFFGFWLLMGQLSGVGDLWSTLETAAWAWVAVAFLLSQSTNFAQAYALTGSVSTPLPFGPVVGLQFGLAFTGLVGGTVANTATIIRFFQRRGLGASVAVSSGVLVSIASSAVQAVLFLVCYLFVHGDFSWSGLGGGGSGDSGLGRLILLVIIGGGLVAGVTVIVPRFRRSVMAKVRPQLADVRANLRELAADPRQTSRLFVGNAVSQVLFALTLGASLHAYGGSASLAALIVINTIASLVGGIAPVPGGMGVMEAGLIAGFTAYGIPVEQATAAVFTSRLFTAYLPPAWGWPALAWLRRNEYL